MNTFDEDEGGFGHPFGGYDLKLMAEQLAAVMDLTSSLALEVNSLRAKLDEMSLLASAPVGTWQPKNWRKNG